VRIPAGCWTTAPLFRCHLYWLLHSFRCNRKSNRGEGEASTPALTPITKDRNPMIEADRVHSTPRITALKIREERQ
jgi:hypothetical protein